MTKSFRSPLCCLALSAALLAGLAQAQPVPAFDAQVQQGEAQLAVGNADSALNFGNAAIRVDPGRWEGYAITGRALLALRRYEDAADALSKAIDRAPAAEQSSLRELRRLSLLTESGAPSGSAAAAPAAPVAPVASAPVPPPAPPAPLASAAPATAVPGPPPAAAPVQQASAESAPAPARRRGRRARVIMLDPADAAWTDASTGLMWSKPSYYPPTATGPWNYPDAAAFCAKLQMLGHDDWRLPTVDELQQVYLVSSSGWHWSEPKFSPESGMNEALKSGLWRVQDFSVNDGDFKANRLLLWSSSPGDLEGEHVGVYFGRPYSVQDATRLGDTFPGGARRHPFHGYAICVRSAH